MMFDKVIINAFISSMLLLAAEASASGSEKSGKNSGKAEKSGKLEKSGKVPKAACPPTMYWNFTEVTDNRVQLRSTATPILGTVNCTDYNYCVGDELIYIHDVYAEPTLETKIGKYHATVKVVFIEADGTSNEIFNAAIKLHDGDSALVSDDTEIYWAGIYNNKERMDSLYTYDVPLLGGTGK